MGIVVESTSPEVTADTYPEALSWVTDSGTVVIYGVGGKRFAEYPLGVWRRAYDDGQPLPGS